MEPWILLLKPIYDKPYLVKHEAYLVLRKTGDLYTTMRVTKRQKMLCWTELPAFRRDLNPDKKPETNNASRFTLHERRFTYG